MTPTGPGATVEQVLAAAPPVRREPGARERIRAMNVAAGRRIAVLDDDPTGSQTVHDVSVVTVFEAGRVRRRAGRRRRHVLHPDEHPQPAGGRGGRAHHGRRQRPAHPGPGWAGRDHQPKRFDPPRARTRRDRCPQHRPATRRGPPVRRDPAGTGVFRGGPVHRRRHPLGESRKAARSPPGRRSSPRTPPSGTGRRT